ncbi:aryl-sulfate sulfotransferase [Dehalobacterium formicoaceticum]|uniref:Aryl-sulfate sulfotransferase n=1 Tax=Dehalobacterium formicoaceticum TaxID=51515 RepID=A0ABT1Y222_9FIRM|nr:aryl-sulfate sulfotransferase [Dehalobacterium formicoaceticum]MCR6544923.1 aryl-sulfate sulfotransferase [Dehalobacterium formicoaceticum]
MGQPFIHPTGVTMYDPEKCFNGYTILNAPKLGTVIIDMNGNVVRVFKDLMGFPNKILPGGYVMGSRGRRNGKFGYQDQVDLIQVDWEGKVVWEFNKLEHIEDEGEKPQWMARQHHDFQREGNPVGYYVPGMECKTDGGNTLILCHKNCYNKRISDKQLLDDVIVEVDWEGNVVWEWNAVDHFNEYGFDAVAKLAIYKNPNMHEAGGGMGDWMHINSMSVLGPNKWYDKGDERFHPDNIIWDARESNICAIISKETGKVVWKMGPDFSDDPKLRKIGQIIGQHHVHMIPQGLPGAGNILIFDNGGWSGYGAPSNVSRDGTKVNIADRSRVLELNPVTMKVVWQIAGSELMDYGSPLINDYRFYSPLTSAAQRLPNGNTFITEGVGGRFFEVTRMKEVVWEFISPFTENPAVIFYRGYRYPYSYIPQLPEPKETAIPKLDIRKFRVPGAADCEVKEENVRSVEGTIGYPAVHQGCVAAGDQDLSLQDDDDYDGYTKF